MADAERQIALLDDDIALVRSDYKRLLQNQKAATDKFAAAETAVTKAEGAADKAAAEAAVVEARAEVKRIEEDIREVVNLMCVLHKRQLLVEVGLTSAPAGTFWIASPIPFAHCILLCCAMCLLLPVVQSGGWSPNSCVFVVSQ